MVMSGRSPPTLWDFYPTLRGMKKDRALKSCALNPGKLPSWLYDKVIVLKITITL